jgi:hypothetical protein
MERIALRSEDLGGRSFERRADNRVLVSLTALRKTRIIRTQLQACFGAANRAPRAPASDRRGAGHGS